MTNLSARLLVAHDKGDRAALIALYQQAAETVTGAERAFFLTQAHIFALDLGHADAPTLRAALIEMGCECPE